MIFYAFVYILAIAIMVALFFRGDETIPSDNYVKLGSPEYDIQPLDHSPAATGGLVRFLSNLVTKSIFGPALRRKLLKQNKVIRLRDLGSQITLPPMYYPMRRLSSEERKLVESPLHCNEAGENCMYDSHIVLQQGLPHWSAFNKDEESYRLRTVHDYYSQYRNKNALPSQIIKNTLQAIKEIESKGQIVFSSLIESDVLQQAAESDKRFKAGKPLSILDGVPIAFKDMSQIKGHNLYYGRDPISSQSIVHTEDDVIVKRFRDLGAIILGLTVMTELGSSPLGYNTHFKGPHNPFSAQRYSGGSSSGSGVAVSLGIVPIAVGFDGGGSIRIPSTLSGVHGLATTFGRCAYGSNAYSSTMIKAGPLAASADDVAIAMAVMAPPEPKHFYTTLYDGGVQGPPMPLLLSSPSMKGLRIGIFKEYFSDATLEIKETCDDAVKYVVSQGAEVVDITIPHLMAASLAHGLKISSEFAMDWSHEYDRSNSTFEPNTRITMAFGKSVTAEEILAGEKLRHYLFEYVTKDLYEKLRLDVIILPTIGIEVPQLKDAAKESGESNTALTLQVMKHIFLANFLGLPSYSVPIAFMRPTQYLPGETYDATFLPVGLQLLGNHWTEHKLIAIAKALENGFISERRRPLYAHDPFRHSK